MRSAAVLREHRLNADHGKGRIDLDVLRQELAQTEGRTRTAVADSGIVGFSTWFSAGDAIEIEDLLPILSGWDRGPAVRWRRT